MDYIKLFPLPVNAAAHGHEVDLLIYLIHALMIVLFVGWGIFFIYTLIRFRKGRNPKAEYGGIHSHTSTVIEVIVALVEVVLLVGFSIPFWAKHVNALPEREDVIQVRVIGEQFAWNVHYPGPDGIFGATAIKHFNKETNPLGLDPNDPKGKDDITTINQLHLPIGRPAVVHVSSKDVMHSFSLPVMRVKQDAIPGMSIPVWFTPTKTGKFEIACAQLCGLGHYYMRGYLTIHNEEDFQEWLEGQATASAEGDGEYDDFWN